MYPYLKLFTVIAKAKFRAPLALDEEAELSLRAGLTDIDLFMELNNARHLTAYELGRWDFSQRIGLIDLIRVKKWGLVVGGASVRYRRRIPFMAKFTVKSRLICHDGRWFYILQEAHHKGNICSSGLMKVGVTSRDGLVPAPQVASSLGKDGWGAHMPQWVSAWIDAESFRPWPTRTDNAIQGRSA